MNTKIIAGIVIIIAGIIVVVVIAKPSGDIITPSASPTPQIPDGITEEEHESHHTNLPQ